MRTTSVPIAGAIAVAEAAGAALVPLGLGLRQPGRPDHGRGVRAHLRHADRALCRALDAGPLDGVYLDLHGAAVVDSFPDAEGELLRRVRAHDRRDCR